MSEPSNERLQKVLADAGLASRREIERWIEAGRIEVNGATAITGQKVKAKDRIKVDGRLFTPARRTEPLRVLLYRKKVGEVVTRDDPEGRPTIFRKLPNLVSGRWITVGRLDINTSGLLLLTNHGELAKRLMHPSHEITREYAVRVLGEITPEIITTLTRTGVMIDGHRAKFDSLAPGLNEEGVSANQWWSATLHEGRQREVRRLIESQKLQVSRLIRTAYGPLVLGRGIKAGGFREATDAERNALLKAVGLDALIDAPTAPGTRSRSTISAAPKRPVKPGDAPSSAKARRAREAADAGFAKPARGGKTKPGGARPTAPGRTRRVAGPAKPRR
ncbi:pseudouridine synthase [Polycyclovorans algicola]|uniref:pseudouridine synthase n=1 Tax=Polycyclovorans algicola TaxID=616992 RepID=UPI000A02424B|nr:pseudouridine synthase [Polycyclovorans algicola]